MTTEPTGPPPAEPKPPPPAPAQSNPLSKPVFVAGLLGGVLGALLSFGLARALPAPVKPPPPGPPSEARQFADHVLGKLKDGKNDEFMALLRPAYAQLTPEQFEQFRKSVFDARANAAKLYGSAAEFEFCRESVLSPTLVRVTYLEKYAHGCVMWLMVVYHAPDGWQVVSCVVRPSESGFPELQ
ncbi:MAG: hypothetical protein J0I06_07655 [Planctomycetes bacterium]|nr:hypothetical protein [Planctomycetota bacterium]